MTARRQVMGIFARPEDAAEALREVRDRRFGGFEVFAPIPDHHLLEAADTGPSRVRYFTLTGGLTGFAAGLLLTGLTSLVYSLVVGGKAPFSLPPYLIISFELTILLGGLCTLLGLLLTGRLPRRKAPRLWDARLSEDRFGVSVECSDNAVEQLDELFRRYGAEDVLRG